MLSLVFAVAVILGLTNGAMLPYSAASFNSVHDFMDVYNWTYRADTITALGDVIKLHGMQNDTILQLLHTHFKLDADEVLIEKMDDSETWTYPYPTGELSAAKANPYLLMFTPAGDVIPLEYVASSRYLSSTRMRSRVSRVVNNRGFTAAFVAKLGELGVLDVFGLGIRHREHLAKKFNGKTVENSNAEQRWYHVRGVAEPRGEGADHGGWCSHEVDVGPTDGGSWCGHDCQHACGSHCDGCAKGSAMTQELKVQVGWAFRRD